MNRCATRRDFLRMAGVDMGACGCTCLTRTDLAATRPLFARHEDGRAVAIDWRFTAGRGTEPSQDDMVPGAWRG